MFSVFRCLLQLGWLLTLTLALDRAQAQPAPHPAATDVLHLAGSSPLAGKVLVIGPDYLLLQPGDSGSGALRPDTVRLALQRVRLIRYANGTREVPRAAPSQFISESYELGRRHAQQYYRPRQAYWGTFGASMVSPVAGLATLLAVRSTPPRLANLAVPDRQLLLDPEYVAGYRRQAQRQKNRKAGAGFGTAMGVDALLLLVVVAAVAGGW